MGITDDLNNALPELRELQRLLDEAYDHYFEHSDGYHKSSEGHISLHFNNYFDRCDGEPLRIKDVEVYSYMLGTRRKHHFATTAEALAAVREWHAAEMARTAEDHEDRFLPVEKLFSDGPE